MTTHSSGSARKETLPFLSFPYVCPEPVLVKRSFLYINGFKSPFFSPSGSARKEKNNGLSCLQLYMKTIVLTRQARDRHKESAQTKDVFARMMDLDVSDRVIFEDNAITMTETGIPPHGNSISGYNYHAHPSSRWW
jgi:hypothetical protein